MSISIIYGKNGAGKTLLAEIKLAEGIRVFNSDVSEWDIENTDENIKISEYEKIKRKHDGFIADKIASIFNAQTSSLFGDQTATNKKKWLANLAKFAKENNFDKFESIFAFTPAELRQIQLTNVELMDLYTFIIDNRQIVEATNEQFEAAILYTYISKVADEGFQTDEVRNINQQLINAKNVLTEIMGDKFTILSTLNVSTLKKLLGRDLTTINEEFRNFLKMTIRGSREFTEAIQLNDRKTAELGNAFIFTRGNTTDDGKTLVIEPRLSKGQKTVKILEAIVDSYSDNKELILDDVFETLDITNATSLAYSLSLKDMKNITVLTHNEELVGMLVRIFESDSAIFEYKEVTTEITTNNGQVVHKPIVSPSFPTIPSLTFEELSGKVADGVASLPMNTNQKCMKLFTNIIGRYSSKSSSWFQESVSLPKTTREFKMYQFSSEKIFHYDGAVDISEFNTIFDQSLPINPARPIVDSIEFIDIIKSNLPTAGKYFGLDWVKIQSYFDEMKYFLNIEKSLYTLPWTPPTGSKSNYLKTHWPDGHQIFGKTRKDRNNAMHQLENTLISIM